MPRGALKRYGQEKQENLGREKDEIKQLTAAISRLSASELNRVKKAVAKRELGVEADIVETKMAESVKVCPHCGHKELRSAGSKGDGNALHFLTDAAKRRLWQFWLLHGLLALPVCRIQFCLAMPALHHFFAANLPGLNEIDRVLMGSPILHPE